MLSLDDSRMPKQRMADRMTMSMRATGSVLFSSCLRVVVNDGCNCGQACAVSEGRATKGGWATGSPNPLQETKRVYQCVPDRGTPAKQVPSHTPAHRRGTQRDLEDSGPTHQPPHKLAENGLTILERPARRVHVLAELRKGEARREGREAGNAVRQDCRVGGSEGDGVRGWVTGWASWRVYAHAIPANNACRRPQYWTTATKTLRTDSGPRDVLSSESDDYVDASTNYASLHMGDMPMGQRV